MKTILRFAAVSLALAVSSVLSAATLFTVAKSGHSVAGNPALIFIPGLACNGRVWDDVIASYTDRYECHVLSLAGFGGSAPVDNHGAFVESVRDELIAYIAENHLERPIIVGHSLGGFIGLSTSIAAPDTLGALLIVDSLPFFPAGVNPGATVESMRAQAEGQRQMMSQGQASPEQMRGMMSMLVTSPSDIDRAAKMGADSDGATVAQAMYELNTTDLRDAVAGSKTPTVVLGSWIAYQPYGSTMESTRAIFAAQYAKHPHVRIEMSATGRHFIQWDDPDFFHAQLEKLLAEVRS